MTTYTNELPANLGIKLSGARVANIGVNLAMLVLAVVLRMLWNRGMLSDAQIMWAALPVVWIWLVTVWNDRRLRYRDGSPR